jgi:hypothetical protein
MKRIRILGLCLVAACAVSGVAVASAWAEAPEYGRCLAKAGGKFKTAACTAPSKPGEERFEWYRAVGGERPLENSKYTSKAIATETATIQFEGTGEKLGTKLVLSCKEETYDGEVIGNKEATASDVVFKGCESEKFPCKTEGAAAGEIRASDLIGLLGIEKRGFNKEKHIEEPAKDKLASEWSPKTGEVWYQAECTVLKVIVKGHVLLPMITNKMVKEATIKFSASGGNQKPEHLSTGINLGTGKETFTEELSLFAAFQKPGAEPELEESGLILTMTQKYLEAKGVEANSVV